MRDRCSSGGIESAIFTIRATDANGCQGTANYSITPVCPTINLSPANGALSSLVRYTIDRTG